MLGVTYDVSKSGPYGTLYLNSATGAFIFVPNDAEINALTAPTTQTYVLTVSNGTLSTSQNLTINILGANDAPTLQPVPGQTITDTGVNSFNPLTGKLVAADVDLPSQTLTYGISLGTSTSFTSGSTTYDVAQTGTYGTLYVNSATGDYIFVPNDTAIKALPQTTKTESFTFTVSDGSLTDTQTFKVTLNGVNDAPAGTNNTVTVNEDATYTFTTQNFGFTDPNDSPANNLLAVKITTLSTAGTLYYDADGAGGNAPVPVTTGQSISAADIGWRHRRRRG